MKHVRAIIRSEKLDPVMEALAAKGFHAAMSTEGMDASTGRVPGTRFRGLKREADLDSWVRIELTVREDEVSEVTAIIRKAACTGNYGGGKILVSPGAMDAVGRIAVWII